jgi:MFS family permease
LGLITEPLIADLGLDRTLFGRINLVTCLLGTAFCLPAGFLLDRFGIRITTACTVLLLGVAVVGMARAQSMFALMLWLFLVRGVGQSALSLVSMAAVSKWFHGRKLGIAMGVYAILLTFGFIGSVLWLGSAVAELGWRTAWSRLGWVLLLGMLPLGLLLARNEPRDVAAGEDSSPIADDSASADFTLGCAIRTSAFWVLAAGAGAFNLVWSALTLFNESILEEHGFNPRAAVNVMAMLVGTGLVSNLVGGALVRRGRVGVLLGFGLSILATALFCFPHGHDAAGALVLRGSDRNLRGACHRRFLFCVGQRLRPGAHRSNSRTGAIDRDHCVGGWARSPGRGPRADRVVYADVLRRVDFDRRPGTGCSPRAHSGG